MRDSGRWAAEPFGPGCMPQGAPTVSHCSEADLGRGQHDSSPHVSIVHANQPLPDSLVPLGGGNREA